MSAWWNDFINGDQFVVLMNIGMIYRCPHVIKRMKLIVKQGISQCDCQLIYVLKCLLYQVTTQRNQFY